MSRLVVASLAALFVCGCATVKLDVIQVGPWFPARPAAEVEVFSSRDETSRPWGGIAVIHGPRLRSIDAKGVEAQRRQARKLAAKAGADGVIISVQPGQTAPMMGGFEEPEIYLSALAIKYVDAVSTTTAR